MTNQELTKEIEEINKKLNKILSWIDEKNEQQLSFPVDKTTKRLIVDAITNP